MDTLNQRIVHLEQGKLPFEITLDMATKSIAFFEEIREASETNRNRFLNREYWDGLSELDKTRNVIDNGVVDSAVQITLQDPNLVTFLVHLLDKLDWNGLPAGKYYLNSRYRVDSHVTLDQVNMTYTDPSTGIEYTFIKDQNIHHCNEIPGYTEVSDKETCKIVGNQIRKLEWNHRNGYNPMPVDNGWDLFNHGNTDLPDFPLGCSIEVLSNNTISDRGVPLYYQTVAGNAYDFTNAKKICQKTPSVPEESIQETGEENDDNNENGQDDKKDDNETMYLWLGAGGALLCLMLLLVLLMVSM